MSVHCPRPPELPVDPDKAFCGVRMPDALHAGATHNPRRMADRPQDVTCDACVLRLWRYAQDVERTKDVLKGVWPWGLSVEQMDEAVGRMFRDAHATGRS